MSERVAARLSAGRTITCLTRARGSRHLDRSFSPQLLQALSGYDPRDATSLRESPPDLLAALDRPVKGFRVAWSPDFGYAAVDRDVMREAANAARAFERLGG